MRTTRSFILRLFIDTEDPQALHGAIHSVTDTKEWSFINGQALLSLLSEFCYAVEHPDEEERRLV